MKKNKISKNWVNKQRRDTYVRQSKVDGYRARSAYKLIEINEKFKDQYNKVLQIMNESGFKLLHKKHYHSCKDQKNKFVKTFNYVFKK